MSKRAIEYDSDIMIITYENDLNLDDAAELRELKKSIALREDIRRIVVDLSKVKIIATPGLGILVSLQKTANENDKELRVCGLSPYVKEIFDLTRLARVFTILPTREEAVK